MSALHQYVSRIVQSILRVYSSFSLPDCEFWGCFRAVSKESQNRYSKSAKDWGWREFLQLHTLFDQEAGFLVSDSVVFAAEVLVLKEVSEVKQVRFWALPL